jgi:hypothetical protein
MGISLPGLLAPTAFVLPVLIFSVRMGSSVIAATLFMLVSGDTSGLIPLIAVTVVVGPSVRAAVSRAHQMKVVDLSSG